MSAELKVYVVIMFKVSNLSVFFFHCSLNDVRSNQYLALDPNVSGVYNGAYPFGIDPVSFILFNYPVVMISFCPLDFGMCISKINLTMKKIHFSLHSPFNKTFSSEKSKIELFLQNSNFSYDLHLR